MNLAVIWWPLCSKNFNFLVKMNCMGAEPVIYPITPGQPMAHPFHPLSVSLWCSESCSEYSHTLLPPDVVDGLQGWKPFEALPGDAILRLWSSMCENNKTSLKALPGEPILKLWSLTCKNNNKPFEKGRSSPYISSCGCGVPWALSLNSDDPERSSFRCCLHTNFNSTRTSSFSNRQPQFTVETWITFCGS